MAESAGTTTAPVDPTTMSPSRWQSRQAALLSHGAGIDDPEVRECGSALAYWRVRRAIDKDRHLLDPAHVAALADMLRHAHPAVSA